MTRSARRDRRNDGPAAARPVGRLRDARVLPSEPADREADRPLRVLVVEDRAPLRRLLVRQLARAGHDVVGEAATAAEALARARALRPDVLVLDVHLPDGLGTAVAADVAGGPAPRPAVVFCTGDLSGALALGAGRASACGDAWEVLEKPATATALDRAVREAAARRLNTP